MRMSADAPTEQRRVLVAGVGNIFLGDDGFGSEVARRLAGVDLPAGVRVVDYGIGGVHLAYELLDGYDQLILVDTVPTGNAPGALTVTEITEDDIGVAGFDAHAMDPGAVLANLRRLGGTLPPTLLVGCRPASVAEAMGLSEPVRAAVDPAIEVVTGLVTGAAATARPRGRSTSDA